MPTRLDRLSARRIDPAITSAKHLHEVYARIHQTDSVRYVIGAMQPIDPEYTQNTYAQGERVKNQLDSNLETKCEFKYQGSVTNDTHIRARSDIDVLSIVRHYYALEPPQVPGNPYEGDPIQDLLSLRSQIVNILKSTFPKATVDDSGSKSIVIEGGSLRRKIDVVPANWLNTNKYAENHHDIYRGVEILDATARTRLPNTPFLHNALIDYVDTQTNGGLRKAARLLKSLKYDSESVDLSSYDIVSIAFRIPEDDLNVPAGQELRILEGCHAFFRDLVSNLYLRNALDVPDEHRKIFANGHATLKGLEQLAAELNQLVNDVLQENARSFRKLAEARVEY